MTSLILPARSAPDAHFRAPQAHLNAAQMRAETPPMPAALRMLVIGASVCALVALCSCDPLGRYAAARWQADHINEWTDK